MGISAYSKFECRFVVRLYQYGYCIAGNVSNVTYAMNAGWNDNCWDYAYRNVMVESLKITNKCKDVWRRMPISRLSIPSAA